MEFVIKFKCFVISVAMLLVFSAIWGVPVYIILSLLDKEDICTAWEYGALCFLAIGWIKENMNIMYNHNEHIFGGE